MGHYRFVAPLETVDKTHCFDIYAAAPKPAKVVPQEQAEKQAILKRIAGWKAEQKRLAEGREKRARKLQVGFVQYAFENQRPKGRRKPPKL